jgi:hypothetical protein
MKMPTLSNMADTAKAKTTSNTKICPVCKAIGGLLDKCGCGCYFTASMADCTAEQLVKWHLNRQRIKTVAKKNYNTWIALLHHDANIREAYERFSGKVERVLDQIAEDK